MVAPSPVRVGVVDDHPIARHGIERALAGVPDLRVVGTGASVAELRSLAEVGPELGSVDVLLLDLYLGGDEPAIADVAEAARTVPVLVLSASRSRADVLAAVGAGAAGYLTKSADEAQLAEAVRGAAAGRFQVSPELADLIQAEMASPSGPRPSLSPRESETLAWIARGYTHAEAARKMGVGLGTVNTYVQRIRAKLGPGNKAQLTRTALETLGPGLFEEP